MLAGEAPPARRVARDAAQLGAALCAAWPCCRQHFWGGVGQHPRLPSQARPRRQMCSPEGHRAGERGGVGARSRRSRLLAGTLLVNRGIGRRRADEKRPDPKVRPSASRLSVGELVQRNLGGAKRPGPDDGRFFSRAGSIRFDVGDFETAVFDAACHQAPGVVLREIHRRAECHHLSALLCGQRNC